MKRSLAVCGLALTFLSAVNAQAPSAATQSTQQDTKQPDVFLDNHRAINPKKDKAPTSRTLTGTVTDDTGAPLENALVTVTAMKSNEKRKFFTKKDGRYTFAELAFTEDFEVQAQWKKLISEPRKLSQYDHNAKVVRLLQVGTPEGYSTPAAAEVKQDSKN